MIPALFSYVMSFIYVGIYWNNHHHLFHITHRVNGAVLWANLHLLFWLSVVPFVTSWMGENHSSAWPIAMYGCALMMAGVAYFILTQSLISLHGRDSAIARAVGRDGKGKLSVLIYIIAIALAFVLPWSSLVLYGVVAIMWFAPDQCIEKIIKEWPWFLFLNSLFKSPFFSFYAGF